MRAGEGMIRGNRVGERVPFSVVEVQTCRVQTWKVVEIKSWDRACRVQASLRGNVRCEPQGKFMLPNVQAELWHDGLPLQAWGQIKAGSLERH